MYSVSIAHSITEWIHLLAEIWKKQSMELSFPHNSWKMWFPPINSFTLQWNSQLKNYFQQSLWNLIFQRITGNSIPVEFGEFTQRPKIDWKDTFQKFYRSLFKMWLPWMHQSNPVFPWNLWKMIFHCNLPVADEFTQKLGKEGFRIKDTEGS